MRNRGSFFPVPTQASDMARNVLRCHFSLSGPAQHRPPPRNAGLGLAAFAWEGQLQVTLPLRSGVCSLLLPIRRR